MINELVKQEVKKAVCRETNLSRNEAELYTLALYIGVCIGAKIERAHPG